jgi:hypothetical protein
MPALRKPSTSATKRAPRAKSANPKAGASSRGTGRGGRGTGMAKTSAPKRAASAKGAAKRVRPSRAAGGLQVRVGNRRLAAERPGKRGSRGQVRSVGRAKRAAGSSRPRTGASATKRSGSAGGSRTGTGAPRRAGTVVAPRTHATNDVLSRGRGGKTRSHVDERYQGGPTITGTGKVVGAFEPATGAQEMEHAMQFPRDEQEKRETEDRQSTNPRWQEEGVSASIHGEGGGTRGITPGTRLRHKQADMQDLERPAGSGRGGKAAGAPAYPQKKGDRFGADRGEKRGERNTGDAEE